MSYVIRFWKHIAFLVVAWRSPYVIVTWDHEPGVTYRIYWGTEPGTYPNHADVGTANEVWVPAGKNTTFYFVVTAWNQDAESLPSEEVSGSGHLRGKN